MDNRYNGSRSITSLLIDRDSDSDSDDDEDVDDDDDDDMFELKLV